MEHTGSPPYDPPDPPDDGWRAAYSLWKRTSIAKQRDTTARMVRQELNPSVAAEVLEATNAVLQHLQRWSIQLQQRDGHRQHELSQLYGKVRRIRDHLTRDMGAHGATVQLDLDDDECNLLATCLVFSLHDIEMELSYGKDLSPDDRAWLEEQRSTLSDLAVDLATEDIRMIPSLGGSKQSGAAVSTVLERVRKKVRATRVEAPWAQELGDVEEREPQARERPGIQAGVWTGSWSGFRNPLPPLSEENPGGPEHGLAAGGHASTGFGTGLRPPSMRGAATQDTPRGRTSEGEQQQQAEQPGREQRNKPSDPQGGLAVDCRLVRDPRLRTMIVLDTRAFGRAWAAKDYRLSAVHLCSVCEAVVVDVALRKRDALKLTGTPGTWRLDEVVKALLGESFTTGDRASLNHLAACRNLIRPAVQLHDPIVVTRTILKTMVEFVQRLLVDLGVSGSGDPAGGPIGGDLPKK